MDTELTDILKDFEEIWIRHHVNGDYSAEKFLSDDDRIDYKIWEDINWKRVYEKHLPDTFVIRGTSDHIIFHGGCLKCKSQQLHGVDRCKNCQYFRADWSKQDLSIK